MNARAKKLGVLYGGFGPEREISLRSGEAIAKALESCGHAVQRIDVDRQIAQVLSASGIEIAVNALHGEYGEDGCIQGLLEVLNIPYTGSGVLASALSMDKTMCKQVLRDVGIPVPRGYAVRADEMKDLIHRHGDFGFPVFVKPRFGGSSVGAGLANNLDELQARCADALKLNSHALVEEYVRGREVAIGLLDERALGGVEIVPSGPFYDYKSKYTKGGSQYFVPPRITEALLARLMKISEHAIATAGTRGAARVDFLIDEKDQPFLLEINTSPGMTETSLLPKIAAHAGMDFPTLCEAIVSRARLDLSEHK